MVEIAMSNDKELYTECQKRIIEIRQKSGYNRKDFCDEFDIPYRTVTEWERGNRNAPEYVIRLLEYYIAMNNLDERMKRSEGTSGYGGDFKGVQGDLRKEYRRCAGLARAEFGTGLG